MAGRAVPILPGRDLGETLSFYERLGSANRGAPPDQWDHLIVGRGGIELHVVAEPDVDPRSTAGFCYLFVDDVDAVFHEWRGSGAVPPGERSEPRLVARQDTGYGMREMALVDRDGDHRWLGPQECAEACRSNMCTTSLATMPSDGATILHADLDAFYASVEQLLDPALRGRPVAVGGGPGGGVVLAASYEAKAFGVQGGMPGWRAARLCPELTFVRGHFREYQRLGDAVMAVLADVTPLVERISIDEAFLDVSGSTHLFGPPETIGATIRQRVRADVGLPISVGAARTKHLAKIASQVAKPDGLVVVQPGTERDFLDPLPVGLIWGVGPVNRQRLADRGIHTIGDLAQTPSSAVERILGHAVGHKLSAMAHDEDPRRIITEHRARSVGAQSALGRRAPNPADVRAVLAHLADRVSRRLRARERAGRTITVRVRFAGMASVTRSRTLSEPVATTLTLTEVAERLVWAAIDDAPRSSEITLLAVSVSNLTDQRTIQLELELPPPDPWRPGSAPGAARRAVDGSMDRIRSRFGGDAVGYLPVVLRRGDAVPDEFRELAEHDL